MFIFTVIICLLSFNIKISAFPVKKFSGDMLIQSKLNGTGDLGDALKMKSNFEVRSQKINLLELILEAQNNSVSPKYKDQFSKASDILNKRTKYYDSETKKPQYLKFAKFLMNKIIKSTSPNVHSEISTISVYKNSVRIPNLEIEELQEDPPSFYSIPNVQYKNNILKENPCINSILPLNPGDTDNDKCRPTPENLEAHTSPFEEGQVSHYSQDESAIKNAPKTPAIFTRMLSDSTKSKKSQDDFEGILEMMNAQDSVAKHDVRPAPTDEITSPSVGADNNVFRDISKMMTTHATFNEIYNYARNSEQRTVNIIDSNYPDVY